MFMTYIKKYPVPDLTNIFQSYYPVIELDKWLLSPMIEGKAYFPFDQLQFGS